jgi:hypothetical protein
MLYKTLVTPAGTKGRSARPGIGAPLVPDWRSRLKNHDYRGFSQPELMNISVGINLICIGKKKKEKEKELVMAGFVGSKALNTN